MPNGDTAGVLKETSRVLLLFQSRVPQKSMRTGKVYYSDSHELMILSFTNKYVLFLTSPTPPVSNICD